MRPLRLRLSLDLSRRTLTLASRTRTRLPLWRRRQFPCMREVQLKGSGVFHDSRRSLKQLPQCLPAPFSMKILAQGVLLSRCRREPRVQKWASSPKTDESRRLQCSHMLQDLAYRKHRFRPVNRRCRPPIWHAWTLFIRKVFGLLRLTSMDRLYWQHKILQPHHRISRHMCSRNHSLRLSRLILAIPVSASLLDRPCNHFNDWNRTFPRYGAIQLPKDHYILFPVSLLVCLSLLRPCCRRRKNFLALARRLLNRMLLRDKYQPSGPTL